jgi:taurine dioxygenase
MALEISKTTGACGAIATGIDLSRQLDSNTVAGLRQAWLEHQVLVFPEQSLSDDDFERFTTYFGAFGDDPFIQPIDGRQHIIAVSRTANEKAPVFAENWHTDWSFQVIPPAGTCLYSIVIPPMGGNTSFINQQKVLASMPEKLRRRIEGKIAIHSARGGYAPDGFYGEREKDLDRSMRIVYSDDAYQVQEHPLIRPHPETGIEAVYGTRGYIIGIKDMEEAEERQLLNDLCNWQTREEFQYSHKWSENMLVMWDNRSVLHAASGGYEGYERLLHRTTIAGQSF